MTTCTTSSGSSTIGVGATASVVLDPSRTIFDLVFARPADLFPLQNTAVMQNIMSGLYPAESIAATSPPQLTLALKFAINLQVYPTSNMATQYYAAVSSGNQTQITNFFQSTQGFQTVTLNSVVTAQSFASSYAYVWAGFTQGFASFNSSITYYLYSTGTPPTGGNQTNQAPPVYQGMLSMTKSPSAPNPAKPADRTGGYQITYTAPNGKTTSVQFAGGQFVFDATDDFPSTALKGSFILKSSLTNQASDNVIIPILLGTVNGIQVMGTTTKQPTSNGPGGFWAFFHPTTFGGYMTLFTSFLGLGMGLEWIGAKCKTFFDWVQSRNANNNPPTQEEEQQEQNQLNEDAPEGVPENMVDAQNDGQNNLVDANNVAVGDAQLDVLQQQAAQVETIEQFGGNEGLESVAGQIRTTTQSLNEALVGIPPATGQDLQSAVDDAATGIANIQGPTIPDPNAPPTLNSMNQQVADGLNADQQEEFKSDTATNAEVQAQAETNVETANKSAEGAKDRTATDVDIEV
jgi:hypothetical protein